MDKKETEHIIRIRRFAPRVERHQVIFENLRFHKVNTILDVGCGMGEFLGAINKTKITKVGVDIDKSCLSEAKQFVDGHFVRSCALNLPFKDDTFDLVTAILILEHVENPTALLEEAHRVTKRKAVFAVPNIGRPSRLISAMLNKDIDIVGGHKQGWDYHLFEHFLENNRWRVIKLATRFVDFPPYHLLPKRLGRFMSYGVLLKLFPRIGSELFAFCRK